LRLFVDRLVDALLEDERVDIPVDVQKRNEASLKYLFTELVCNICGGPEVVTSKAHDETKLLVPKSAWLLFIATADVAADHFPRATRSSLMQVLEANRVHIVDTSSSEADPLPVATSALAATVKDVSAAAAGRMLSKEAIAARHAAPGALVAARKRVLGDPRTLYGRGGGIFGLARLADALMDAWMSDPALNANAKVAKWHECQQTYGFKFLVTQIMGYLTGGPQRYTGRPMEEAHKHLAISAEQWDSFMADASKVFQAFRLDAATQQELCGILSTYQSSCVLAPGETAPADPGLLRPTGSSTSLYHRLGGVYPIAQFADRLVESVLKGDRVHIEHDRLDNPAGKRHPPGLKYMVTELVCNCVGGPELVTSKGFDEAKLGVQPHEWPAFIELASEAAQLWPVPQLRNSLMGALGTVKVEICIGVLDEDASPEAGARRMVQEAGFDFFLASAALEKSAGDAARALELLAKGWMPEDQEAVSVPGSMSSRSSLPGGWDPDAPRCPFSRSAGSGAALPPGHPPIRPAHQASAPVVKDEVAIAARALADRGMSPAQIAPLLGIDEAAATAAVSGRSGTSAGRVLGSGLQVKLDKLMEEDPDLCCPVSLVLFVEPVIASDGFMYDKASIQQLLRNRMPSPMTREELKADFLPARQRRSAAMEFRQARCEALLAFAEEAAGPQPNMAGEALQRATEYIDVLQADHVPTLASRAASLRRQLDQPAVARRGWGFLGF